MAAVPPIPQAEREQAEIALQMVLQWVVSPLVESTKAVCERIDQLNGNLGRLADALERLAPPRPPTTT